MGHYNHLREIAVLPCLPAGLSVEDSCLDRSSPCFDLQFAIPNDAFARMLAFINVSIDSWGFPSNIAEPPGGGRRRRRGGSVD